MDFGVHVVGNSAAVPAYGRNTSAQLIKIDNELFLIDCGEGTQQILNTNNTKPNKISHIFISHLHGDHYFGLIGLLSSFHLFGRIKPLYLYAHARLKEIIDLQLKASDTQLGYLLHFVTIGGSSGEEVLVENDKYKVTTFPLSHRIICNGFKICRKPGRRKLIKEKLPESLRIEEIGRLLKGEDLYDEKGQLKFRNSDLAYPPPVSRSYAYCSDTSFNPDMVKFIERVDLLYHEATFLDELRDRAEQTNHSTALQAAQIAHMAQVKKLMLGHFSNRYESLDLLLHEAKSVFPDTILSEQGKTFWI